jgi:hypothetical protein
MNRTAVARELVAVSRELVAVVPSSIQTDIHDAAGKVLRAGRDAAANSKLFRNRKTSVIYEQVADECGDIYRRLVALEKKVESALEGEEQIRKNIEDRPKDWDNDAALFYVHRYERTRSPSGDAVREHFSNNERSASVPFRVWDKQRVGFMA